MNNDEIAEKLEIINSKFNNINSSSVFITEKSNAFMNKTIFKNTGDIVLKDSSSKIISSVFYGGINGLYKSNFNHFRLSKFMEIKESIC